MEETNKPQESSSNQNQGQGSQSGNSGNQQGGNNSGQQTNIQTGESFLRGPLRDGLSTKSGNIPSEKK